MAWRTQTSYSWVLRRWQSPRPLDLTAYFSIFIYFSQIWGKNSKTGNYREVNNNKRIDFQTFRDWSVSKKYQTKLNSAPIDEWMGRRERIREREEERKNGGKRWTEQPDNGERYEEIDRWREWEREREVERQRAERPREKEWQNERIIEKDGQSILTMERDDRWRERGREREEREVSLKMSKIWV